MQPVFLIVLSVTHNGSGMHLFFVLFSVFVLPLFIYTFFNTSCFLGITTPLPKLEKPNPKPIPEPEHSPEWHGTWNDAPEDSWFDPEPQTDSQLIDDVIAGLQNVGFKKRDARVAVLKACEGKVFEDHQSLIEAALNKSNL